MSLINWIRHEMDNDDEDTAEQKEAIDNAMICLCGWSLKTAIERTTP